MKFTIRDRIPFQREQVYRTQRDQLAELATYLNDIDEIIVESREEEGDVVKFVNLWKASATEIPTMARPFIKPEMLHWHDYATWDQSAWTCDWDIKLAFLRDAIVARGKNHWKENGDSTIVTIEGEIIIHADKVPGVPRMLAGRLGDTVEKFVVKMIEPNLKKTNEGVTAFLRANG